jgi:hypothetical protein
LRSRTRHEASTSPSCPSMLRMLHTPQKHGALRSAVSSPCAQAAPNTASTTHWTARCMRRRRQYLPPHTVPTHPWPRLIARSDIRPAAPRPQQQHAQSTGNPGLAMARVHRQSTGCLRIISLRPQSASRCTKPQEVATVLRMQERGLVLFDWLGGRPLGGSSTGGSCNAPTPPQFDSFVLWGCSGPALVGWPCWKLGQHIECEE